MAAIQNIPGNTKPHYEENLKKVWHNQDNDLFYNNLSREEYAIFSELSGLSKCPDISSIEDYIIDAQTVAEFGAGYGRAIEKIRDINPFATIYGFEKSNRMHNASKTLFSSDLNIKIRKHDLMIPIKNTPKFDIGLLLWATHSTFNLEEQKQLFSNLSQTITKGGFFIIDTCSGNNKRGFQTNQYYKAVYKQYDHFGAMTQSQVIFEILLKLGMSFTEVITYEKTVYGERQLIVFQKL